MNITNNELKNYIKIDLHLHSDLSDGYHNLYELAELVKEENIIFASLTDHQSVKGINEISNYFNSYGISNINGVELHASFNEKELHILAYGFELNNSELLNNLKNINNISDTINMIHKSGGLAILAHPLNYGMSNQELFTTIKHLKNIGLDGLEGYYKPYSVNEQEKLIIIADKLDLLITGGSDYHAPGISLKPGVEIPIYRWKQFRNALKNIKESNKEEYIKNKKSNIDHKININWRWLFLHIILPSILVISFFIILIFVFLIPNFEELLLERKKDMTTELTNSAWSILQDYNREYNEGNLSLEQAQNMAIERIRQIRFGEENKDYFWITDMTPVMIMHPYRIDLEGVDLSDFTDPDGVKPFVEFVRRVETHNSGYVRYIWQWQDVPERMEAKESYVRGFEPWNWIIGTGLYVEDVQTQIQELTRNLIDISFIFVLISGGLLLIITSQSLKLEKRRSEIEDDLRISNEHYKALVEASSSGTILIEKGRCTYANKPILDLIGYDLRELSFFDIHDLIKISDNNESYKILDEISNGEKQIEPMEAEIKSKDNKTIPIILSANTIFFSGKQAVILNIQDISRHSARKNEIEREKIISKLQTSLLFLTEPVSESMSKPISCYYETSISQAISIMNKNQTGSLIITDKEENLIGIVTDRDLRERVLGNNTDLKEKIYTIMSSPVITVNESAPTFEAIFILHDKNIDHLVVIDSSKKTKGIIKSSQIMKYDQYSTTLLTYKIKNSTTIEQLQEIQERVPKIISSLLEAGALPENISQIITNVSDEIYKKVIEFILNELGPAPTKFAVILLGSEARKEQTLATDQDNAIIYEDVENNQSAISEYFMLFGEKLCSSLNTIGYSYCKGNNMAMNKKWNQSLNHWKEYFTDWITEPDNKALVNCNVFFDQRIIYGDNNLLEELKKHIQRLQKEYPSFLSHMALNTLNYKPPIGAFGKIITDTENNQEKRFNIKESIIPIINYARLYAIKYEINETNTLDRLEQMYLQKIIEEEQYRTIIQAYLHLMELRYKNQIDRVKENKSPDNHIIMSGLTEMDKIILKSSFSQISLIQKKVAHDFHVNT